MKWIAILGLFLVIFGVVALIYGGIPYTTWHKVFQIGRLEGIAKTEKMIPLPPVLGGAAMAGGIVLVVIGAKK